MTSDRLGIIGLGFVGNAIHSSLSLSTVETILIDPAKGYNTPYEELNKTTGVFVCVPSPMTENGECDPSILESVLSKLKSIDYKGVIISKTTCLPNVYSKWQKMMPNLVHVPEFLTAANAQADYENGTFTFIGGAVNAYINEAERIVKITQPNLKRIRHCTIEEASLVKYTINSFLATKVIFMNELYQLANQIGCDYQLVADMARLDSRIGMSHMQVPGPDGSFGFGGMCFPKDTSALLKYAESIGISMNVLDSAVKKNTLLRLTEPK